MKFVLALLLLVAPAHSGRTTPLPPIPSSVFSVYGPIPVIREHPVRCSPSPTVIGCFMTIQRLIVVDDSLSPVMAWRVLKHEQVHVALRDANVRLTNAEDEEIAANAVANYQVAQMGQP